MAWTLTTLRDALSSFNQSNETTFDAYRDTFITQAEDRIYKAVIMPANRTTTNLTVTAGTFTANLPADFLAPFELRMVVNDVYMPVLYTDVSMIRELYPNPNYAGVPRWYSLYNDSQIILSPTPTSGITGYFNYFAKPESITVTSSGTSWLGDHAENCLLYACLVEAYGFLKGEADLMTYYENKFKAALDDLRKLGEGMDLGDAYRMGESRVGKTTP